jgi:eukaryotic-like serine/threonine-protein kinase
MMDQSDPSTSPSAPGPLPERLGQRFALGELIGRGTCSEVYRAHDLLLDRDAAVKIFPVADDPRIEREVSLTASMDHPNLVPVYDVGSVNGRAFVVMALLEGGNLSDRLADGPLPVTETLLAVAAVADALGHVHRAGVLHRDVTPRNVLFDGDGRAHLSDFGVAFVADAPRITDTGIVVGSAPYLAPEQVRGEAVGPPADVYALGLVMIEAPTGRPAYEGAPLAAARERLERRPEVPEGLDFEIVTLLEAMTADDPAHRPPAENVCIGLRRAALAAETLPADGAPLPFAGLGLPGLLPEATTDTFATAGAAAAAAREETPGREPRPVLARSGGLMIAASVAAAVLLAGGVVVASAWTVDSVAASAPPAATLAPPTAEIVADPGPGSLVGRGSGRSEARGEDRGSRGDDEPVTVRRGSSASQRAVATTSTDGGAASSAPRETTSRAPATETSPEPTRETTPESSPSPSPSLEPSESTEPSTPSLAPGVPLPSVSLPSVSLPSASLPSVTVPSVSLPLPTGTSSTTSPAPSSSSTASSSTASSSTASSSTASSSTASRSTSSAASSSTTVADPTSSAPASRTPASRTPASRAPASRTPASRTEASTDAASSTTTATPPRRAAALTDPAVEALGGVLGRR